MVHISVNKFFSWISSIFVGFFKCSRFFCVTLYLPDSTARGHRLMGLNACIQYHYKPDLTDGSHLTAYLSPKLRQKSSLDDTITDNFVATPSSVIQDKI